MEKILARIIAHGKKQRDDNEYISLLLFNVLTGFLQVPGLRKFQIDDEDFIDIDSIPEEIRDQLGLIKRTRPSWKAIEEKYKNEGIDIGTLMIEEPVAEKIKDPFAETDVLRAMEKAKDCEYEFIDYFVDKREIEKKSVTLSLLKAIAPNKSDKKYLKTVFRTLKEKNVECEFPLDKFENFYRKLKWFCKVGWANGCINIGYNPTL